MYIHFEDWSQFKFRLSDKGIPHGEKIIKAYASYDNPRLILGRQELFVVESDHKPLAESFEYEGRGSYKGEDLEKHMQELELTALAKDIARALFRFSNRADVSLSQFAMSAQHEGRWIFSHPFANIHGVTQARKELSTRERGIHIDIFHPVSLQKLKTLFDLNDKRQIATIPEGQLLREGLSTRSKEIR